MPDVYTEIGDETIRILNTLCERLRKKGFHVAMAVSMKRGEEGLYFPIFAPTAKPDEDYDAWCEQKSNCELSLTYAVADLINMDDDAKGYDPATSPQ